ncbi:MAG TPA: hypothetical protein VFZ21_07685 [Gemmatimonadaceae bacterium]|nr:hypothetical protein [Gemmatimonadaceae bacterium]
MRQIRRALAILAASAGTLTGQQASSTRGDTLFLEVKVEERKRDGSLQANWYLLRESPYMVYGEVPLPDGRIQRMTEVPYPER